MHFLKRRRMCILKTHRVSSSSRGCSPINIRRFRLFSDRTIKKTSLNPSFLPSLIVSCTLFSFVPLHNANFSSSFPLQTPFNIPISPPLYHKITTIISPQSFSPTPCQSSKCSQIRRHFVLHQPRHRRRRRVP